MNILSKDKLFRKYNHAKNIREKYDDWNKSYSNDDIRTEIKMFNNQVDEYSTSDLIDIDILKSIAYTRNMYNALDVNNDLEISRQYQNKFKNAIDRGIEFDLSFSEYKKLKSRKRCVYTGLKLTSENFSLDRIDNNEGYTKENTVPCDINVNKLKAEMFENQSIIDVDKIIMLCNNYKKLRGLNG